MTEIYRYNVYIERWNYERGEEILYRMIVSHDEQIVEVRIDTISNIIIRAEFYNAGKSICLGTRCISSQIMYIS